MRGLDVDCQLEMNGGSVHFHVTFITIQLLPPTLCMAIKEGGRKEGREVNIKNVREGLFSTMQLYCILPGMLMWKYIAKLELRIDH